MSDIDSPRCHDCLAEFGDSPRFAVLKRMRDVPVPAVNLNEPWADPVEARMLQAMCFDPVPVCADCAGWYGDEAIEVTRW